MKPEWCMPGWEKRLDGKPIHFFSQSKKSSVLYIGIAPNTFQTSDPTQLQKPYWGKSVVLEIWGEYVEFARKRMKSEVEIVHGNVCDVSNLFSDKFDFVVWRSGPEHLEENEMGLVLEQLETLANEWIFLACPWGKYEQGEKDGNPFQAHKSTIYPNMLRRRGYRTWENGKQNDSSGVIYAAKPMNEWTRQRLYEIFIDRDKNPKFVAMGSYSAQAMEFAAEAGFTHFIVIVDPFDEAAQIRLNKASELERKIIIRPRQWKASQVYEKWKFRNIHGEPPSADGGRECNLFPSIFNDEAFKEVVNPVVDVRKWCEQKGIDVSGIYLGVSNEFGLPRQFAKNPELDWLYVWDEATVKAYKKFICDRRDLFKDPSPTVSRDVHENGSETLRFLYRGMVDWIDRFVNEFPGLRPWLPIQTPGLERPTSQKTVGIASGVPLLLEYIVLYSKYINNMVFLTCSLYDTRTGHNFADPVAHIVLRTKEYGLDNIVGVEGPDGIYGGNIQRAKRDGFNGIVMCIDSLKKEDVKKIKGEIKSWY